jgi:hypothetical protein
MLRPSWSICLIDSEFKVLEGESHHLEPSHPRPKTFTTIDSIGIHVLDCRLIKSYHSGLLPDGCELERRSLVFFDILRIFKFGFDIVSCLGLAVLVEDLLGLFEIVLRIAYLIKAEIYTSQKFQRFCDLDTGISKDFFF